MSVFGWMSLDGAVVWMKWCEHPLSTMAEWVAVDVVVSGGGLSVDNK